VADPILLGASRSFPKTMEMSIEADEQIKAELAAAR
jgi:hypothetical protein